MKPARGPTKVLYIMGSGRSGSTFIDIVLGSHPGIQSVGELANVARSGWIGNRYCSCGKRASDCPFWPEVRQAWAQRIGKDDVEGYLALQNTFERYRSGPRLLRERRKPSPQFRAYARYTQALFEAIREVSGEEIIVDSSKDPVRAFALSMLPGIDLYLVHLTRDGRGVAVSLNKSWRKDERAGLPKAMKAFPLWKTAVLWIGANLLSEWVRRQLDPERSIWVRYEAFVADPKNALDSIGHLLHIDLAEVADAILAGESISPGHDIEGNRLRMAKSVRLRPDAGRWQDDLSGNEQKLLWLLIGWLSRRYGYRYEYKE